jgi:hypothetical protein
MPKPTVIGGRKVLTHLCATILLGASSTFVFAGAASLSVAEAPAPADGVTTFNNLATAIDVGRALNGGGYNVTINVAAGRYLIPQPLLLDYPVTLIGSTVPVLDKDKRPTGEASGDRETVIAIGPGSPDASLIVISPPGGSSTIPGVVVSNLTLEGTSSGTSRSGMISAVRAERLMIRAMILRGNGVAGGIDVVSSAGTVDQNFVTNSGSCGICIAGGPDDAPANVYVLNNRSNANVAGGMLLSATAQNPVAGIDQSLTIELINNDLSGNKRSPLGFGLRILATNSSLVTETSEGLVRSSVSAIVGGNRFADNLYALMVDAGFARRNRPRTTPAVCEDARTFSTDIDIQIDKKNVLQGNTKSPALLTVNRAQVLLNSTPNPQSDWQILHESSINVVDAGRVLATAGKFNQGTFAASLVDPAVDLYPTGSVVGVCPADGANEVLHNTMRYNGLPVSDFM